MSRRVLVCGATQSEPRHETTGVKIVRLLVNGMNEVCDEILAFAIEAMNTANSFAREMSRIPGLPNNAWPEVSI